MVRLCCRLSIQTVHTRLKHASLVHTYQHTKPFLKDADKRHCLNIATGNYTRKDQTRLPKQFRGTHCILWQI